MTCHNRADLSPLKLVLSAIAAGACGPAPEPAVDGNLQRVTQAVLEGTFTDENPEIGKLTYTRSNGAVELCSGTLIRRMESPMESAVLTAGHCVGFSTSNRERYRFHINGNVYTVWAIKVLAHPAPYRLETDEQIESHWAAVRQRTPDRIGNNDLAVLLLWQHVPSWVATPASLATSPPEEGGMFTIVGYGDSDRATASGAGLKRYITYPFRAPGPFGSDAQRDTAGYGHIGSGDSGGPALVGNLTDRQNGALVLWGVISSGSGSGDWFGNVVHYRNWIQPPVPSCTNYGPHCDTVAGYALEFDWARCDKGEGVLGDLYRLTYDGGFYGFCHM